MRLKFLLTMLSALFFSFAFSQETTSEIQGTVTDGKAGLGNATVVAVHLPTGTK